MEICAQAESLKGGAGALEALLPDIKSAQELAGIGDDRWLADMTKRIFQASFNWSLVDKK